MKNNHLNKYFNLNCFFISAILLISNLGFGQFNTLKRDEKKDEYQTIEIKKEIDSSKLKKKKKWKLFNNRTDKSELKKTIDSLKNELIERDKIIQEDKFNEKIKSLEDSLKLRITKELLKELVSFKKSKKTNHIAELNFTIPIDRKIEITSNFGLRNHPISGGIKMHNGIDIKANYEYVYSVLDGIVSDVGWDNKGGGNYIKIRHSNLYETSYLHLKEAYYKKGDFVKAGFIIAKSGESGNTTGPHLHFAVKKNGKFINPIKFLNELIKLNNIYNGKELANR